MIAKTFIPKIAVHAVRDMQKTKVPASLTIAQAILESNWGRSGLAVQSNNLFGIKDFSGNGRMYKTKEFYNGKWVTVDAPFKEYPTWYESIQDHSALILRGTRDKPKRYHAVLGETDYKKAAVAIQQGGYATDPSYAKLLISIIEKYKLYDYDRQGDENMLQLTDSQWQMLQKQLQTYQKNGLIHDDSWVEKANKRTLTLSELTLLNTLLLSRA